VLGDHHNDSYTSFSVLVPFRCFTGPIPSGSKAKPDSFIVRSLPAQKAEMQSPVTVRQLHKTGRQCLMRLCRPGGEEEGESKSKFV